MTKQFSFIICMLLFNIQAFTQTIGNHASDINWKSIENENVKVIYPKNTKEQAKRIADIIKHINNFNTESVGSKWKKFDLILQTQQVSSNGFVTVAPFRSEFFGTPPQNFSTLGSSDWLELLAIHEYRHVLQYANLDRGFTKLLHIINGDFGWGSSISFKIPSWYLEGDAVLSETLLTENGRGRNPYFFKEQRALLLNNIHYSYMKARNGSFKSIVPNRYPLGFVMVNYLRNNFNFTTASKILAHSGATISPFYTFSSSLKKFTGFTTKELYEKSHTDLKKKWQDAIKNEKTTESILITTKNKNTVTNYTFPYFDENDGIYCLKNAYNSTPEIVYLINNKEKSITNVGITSQEYLSFQNEKLLWTELEVDIRRANKNYSNIISYDLKTKTKKQLTRKGKYFSPNLSKNSKKIIAVNTKENLQNNLVVLNSETGKEIKTIENPINDYISYPKWTSNNNIIYLAKRNSKIAFFKYDTATDAPIQITSWTAHTIGHFQISENSIYYTASFNGIDNIYCTSIKHPSRTVQMSSVKTGVFTPAINSINKKIVYSEFTPKGYELRNIASDPIKNITIIEPIDQKLHNIKTSKHENPILNNIAQNTYTEKKHSGLFRGFKLHSWGVDFYNSTVNNQAYYMQFNNLLNDLSADFSLTHNRNENTFESRGAISYGKYFIIGNGIFSNSERNIGFVNNLNEFETRNFKENKLSIGFSIPLKRIKGNYSSSLNLSGYFKHHNTYNYTESPHKKFNFNSYSTRISISNFRRTALQNLGPKFGQYFEFNIHKSIENGIAENYNFNSTLYFPGLFKNHSLSLNAFWNKQPITTTYRFTDRFNYARGYKAILNKEGNTLRANYQFPIYYPDWGFWNITYFKRIRTNLFYDRSTLTRPAINDIDELIDFKAAQNSYGIEILFDNTILNNYAFTFGLRNSFLQNTDLQVNLDKYVPEFIFTIGF